jgi:hypothetical protein
VLQIDQQQIDRSVSVEVSGLSEYFWRDNQKVAPVLSDPLEAMLAKEDETRSDEF